MSASAIAPQASHEGSKLKLFISYARRDIGAAEQIVAALESRGFDVLIDKRDLPLLEKWQDELLHFIRASDSVVFIISTASVGSEWCQWEIDRVTELGKRLAPVIIETVNLDRVPSVVREINFVDFAPPCAFDQQANRLAAALNTNARWIKEHTRLAELGRRWLERSNSADLLLRGDELDDAQRWIINRPKIAPDPTNVHRKLIEASLSNREAERAEAERQKERIERALGAATKASSALVYDLAAKFRNMAGVPQQVIREILERAQALLDELAAGGETLPALEYDRAAALAELGVTLLQSGDSAGARRACQSAVATMRARLAASPDDPVAKRLLGLCLGRLADIETAEGKLETGVALRREALAIEAGAEPLESQTRAGVNDVVSHQKLAEELMAAGRRDEALQHHRIAKETAEKLVEANPDDADARHVLMVCHSMLTDFYFHEGHHALGRVSAERAVYIAKQLIEDFPHHTTYLSDAAACHSRLGMALVSEKRDEEALAAHRHAVSIGEKLVGMDPTRTDWQRNLAIGYNKVANLLEGDGKLAHYRKGLAIREKLVAMQPGRADWQRDIAISNQFIGQCHMGAGEGQAALQAYMTSLDVLERLAGAEPSRADRQFDLARVYSELAAAYEAMGDSSAAEDYTRREIEIVERLSASDPDNAHFQISFAMACGGAARRGIDKAKNYERELEIFRRLDAQGRLPPQLRGMIENIETTIMLDSTIAALGGGGRR